MSMSIALREAELQVSDCFYYSLFASEDVEHLASCSCCSQDSVWSVSPGCKYGAPSSQLLLTASR